MTLIFVALCDYEHFLTTKISRFTVDVFHVRRPLFQYLQVTHGKQVSTQCLINHLSLLTVHAYKCSLVLFLTRVVCQQLHGDVHVHSHKA